MKKIIGMMMLLIAFSFQLSAQNSKVTSGVLAEQGGETAQAIEKLQEALSKPELIKKGKIIAKAHYHLHKAFVKVGRDTSLTELRSLYPDALFKAADHLTKAISHPDGKTYQVRAVTENAQGILWESLYIQGVNVFNSGSDDQLALKYFKAAGEIDPDHFLTNRMLGTAYLTNEDTVNSISSLEKALDIYKEKYIDAEEKVKTINKATPAFAQDSSQLSYIYQQLAVIFNAQGNTDKGLETLANGMEMLPGDEDLKRQELAIYQQNPKLVDKAVEKFKSAIEASPSDNNLKLAFASLLEKNARADEAFAYYKEVYESDPESLQANYGMGAYYVNKAASVSDAKMNLKSDEDSKIEEMNEEIKGLLTKAYPFMVWLHNKQPNEREWLSQLVSITPIIGKDDEMEIYGKKLGELSN